MNPFAETLFRPSRFVRWTLTPTLLFFMVVPPFLVPHWRPAAIVIMTAMELLCLCLLLGFYLPPRPALWAYRTLAGIIFLAYAAYLTHALFSHDATFGALAGFLMIGLPCLCFATLGRFTPRGPKPEDMLECTDEDMPDDAEEL